MKDLTRAEEQIMHILWEIEKGFVKDVLERLPLPKPAYNTVSTIIRVLESKGVVGYTAFGKAHQYFPLIKKEDYRRFATEKLMSNYYGDSIQSMLSYFADEQKLDLEDMDGIMKMIDEIKNRPR